MPEDKRIILLVSPSMAPQNSLEVFYEKAFNALGLHVILVRTKHHVNIFDKVKQQVRKRISMHSRRGLKPDYHGYELLDLAENIRPYFTIVFRGERLTREVVVGLNNFSSEGCLCIYSDNPFIIPGKDVYQLTDVFQAYRIIFVFSRQLIPIFYQLGAKDVRWLPFAHDPETHFPCRPTHNIITPIIYFGTWGPLQEWWLGMLVEHGLSIFGTNWENLPKENQLQTCWKKGRGIGLAMGAEVSQASIVFNMVRAEAGCGSTMKTFEIPACGGFMLTNRTEEQEEFFKDKFECIYYDCVEDLKEKIYFYIKNNSERRRIVANAFVQAKNHTYVDRVKQILNILA